MDNKAIKVRFNGSESAKPADLQTEMSKTISLRLNHAVIELDLKKDDDDSWYDKIRNIEDALRDELEAFSKAHGMEEYKKLRGAVFGKAFKVAPELKTLKENAENEIGEILKHVEAILKAKLLAFASEYSETETEMQAKLRKEAKEMIATAMKTGKAPEGSEEE